jgi:hypothetical protein
MAENAVIANSGPPLGGDRSLLMHVSAPRTNDLRSLRTQTGHIDKLHGRALVHLVSLSANFIAALSPAFSARIISA